MEEEKGGGGGGGESSRVSSSFVEAGDRQRFTVELRPGETTIVSWKKLIKDANKANGSTSAPEPPSNAHPALESRIAPGQPAETELNDEPAPNRFSAVIEKIERLYMGKQSSDEEDLDDIPDDDQYDTEDSFIDDAELDEYFQVDNSSTKHNGFFVNRGKLERIFSSTRNEPTLLPNQKQKKRRRKDLTKAHGEGDDGHIPNKHVKMGKMAAERPAPLVGKNTSTPSQILAIKGEHYEDAKLQNQMNASVIGSKKKSADTKTTLDPSLSLKVSSGDASVSLAEAKETEKQKAVVLQSKNLGNKLKDLSVSSDASHQKYHDRNAYAQSKSQSGRQLNSADEQELSVRQREKNGFRELPDLNIAEGKHSMLTTKAPQMHRKDGSSVRPKGSVLEKAIRELERMVAESRPPTMELQDADSASQAVKRRLPREIKQKLAKVARLAANHGKLSKELINRLMSILGHLIQLRTLKRNLKIMINMGLSAKQEKDNRFQQIKREVVEMIKMQPPKEFEPQAGASDDFQELCPEEKGVIKRKFTMDDAMEEKICDLYDLYVDGLDEDAAPQIRKLYGELAQLWPNGSMDNHGIKRAICRAKERRRVLYNQHKDQEKIKRKKLLSPKIEETVRVEVGSIAQPQYMRERLATDSGSHALPSLNRPVSNTTVAVRMHSPSMNGPYVDRLKQEKVKVSSSISLDDVRVADGTLPKKKVKRKPEPELGEAHLRPEKLPLQQGEERHKSHKQAAGIPQRSNLQSASLPSFEQLS